MTRLPASAHATPMTYAGPKSGRQFVLIAAGGGNKYNNEYMSKLVAFALPRNGDPREPRVISAAPAKPRFRADYKGAEEKLPGVAPAQPLPFSHRVHSQIELKCVDCHSTVAKDAGAGLPGAAKCAACHKAPHRASSPVQWVRVYKVPDFVMFSHARHVNGNVQCADCHGSVPERDVLAKEVPTNMVSCMNCHASRGASNACNVCHELGQ